MRNRTTTLIVTAAAVLAVVLVGGAWLLASQQQPPAQATETARTLPDGRTATAAQSAYLDAVQPHLTTINASDVLKVLSSGENGVCGVWAHPAQSRGLAVQMLMESSSYNQTEATAIARAASEHLCPEKG